MTTSTIIVKDANGTNRSMKTDETATIHTPFHILQSSNGVEAGVTQYGYLRVTQEPTAWFTDPIDTLDTTNRWTTKLATGTATVTNGVLSLNSSTTASAYGGIFTQPSFAPNGINFVAFGLTQIIPNVVQANTLRFWGWGSVQTTPTTTAPIINGCGFELDGAGALTAVVYQNGTKSNSVAISPTLTNNVPFYSAVARRSDRIDFYINSTIDPVATILIPTLFVATLPFQAICINAASAPAAAAQMNILAFGIGDTGMNAQAIADPAFPWRRATVKPASTAAATADPALVVSFAGANSATRIGDGTNNAAVKAASTAAAATDPAVVVSLSPNSPISGQAAHDAVIAGNPVRIAGRAQTANYASVATGDVADLTTTLQGVLVTRPWQIPELEWTYAAPSGGITVTTDVAVQAAAGAGLRRYVTSLQASNNSATATELVLKDGASTVIWRAWLPANTPNFTVSFDNPLRTTAATALNAACSVAAAVYLNAQGYTAP